ncbi:phospholipase D family protein [Rhizobium leguminosarum]|uniref:phospholipase D family protein n=1 Tax=Rhizobium leguminosarum TaxID=384 RepID=UPI003F95FC35
MTRFLNETTALTTVNEMLSAADTATLVVAFWGAGAIGALGLRKPWKSLRVVCNLDSGACNPNEIKDLMTLGANVEVRTDWRLHGKVYLTPERLVIGSSNASNNGLVVEGPMAMGWAEANVESTDAALMSQAREWCDARFEQAVEIDEIKLKFARVAWAARRSAAPAAGGLSNDLLVAVRRDPGHPAFNAIKIVQWAQTVSAEAEIVHQKAMASDPSLTGTEIYEGWGKELLVGDWLIDFDVSGSPAKFTNYWLVVHHDDASDVTFARESKCIEIPTLGPLMISEADRTLLEANVSKLAGKKMGPHEKMTRIAQAVAALDAKVGSLT